MKTKIKRLKPDINNSNNQNLKKIHLIAQAVRNEFRIDLAKIQTDLTDIDSIIESHFASK